MLKTVKISDICEFQSGLWKGKKKPLTSANVIRNTNFRPSGNLSYENIALIEVEAKELSKRQLKHGDIILEKSGGGEKTPVGRVCLFKKQDNKIPFSLSNFTCYIRVKEPSIIDYKYLHKFLYFIYESGKTEPMQRNSTGIRNLQLKEYKNISITLPSIAEQRRIVNKLDETIAEIDNYILLKKNKLSNLEIIETKIINKLILKHGSDFIKRPLHSLFNLSSGKFLPRKKMNHNGKIKVYGGNGISGYHDNYNLENENVLIGRVGAHCGNVYYANEKIWVTDNCLHINSYKYNFDKQFLSMLLSSLNLREYAHQTAQPAISYSSLKDIKLTFPKSIKEQIIIFKNYIDLRKDLEKLNYIYENQMISLKKFKLSILNKEILN